MLKKLIALFRKSDTRTTNKQNGTLEAKRTIDPTHIGDLGEYKIEVQLRQFPNESKYVNDVLLPYPRSKTGYSQIDHVLITPYALFVIETKNYKGIVRGKREAVNWYVNGKFKMYNPVKQNRTHINALRRVLSEWRDIRYISVVSFTKRCDELDIDPELRQIDSDELVVYDIKFTDYIERKIARLKREAKSPLSESDVARLIEVISDNNILDPAIRAEHVQKARAMDSRQ